MVKRNKVANMDNNDEFTIKVEDPNSSTVESNNAKTSKKVGGGLKKPKLENENELKPPKSNDPNISEHQLNDLNRSNSSVSRLEKWTQPREVDYLFAARLVKDARDLRNLTFKKTEHNLKSYERYLDIKMAIVVYVTIFVHLMLPLIEEPAVWPTPYWVPCCIELICLCVYTLRWINARSFQTRESFRIDKKNFIVLVIIILIFLDIVAFIAVNATEVGFRHRFTRPLRVLIYINFNEGKELRRAIRNVRKTLPDIFNVFALFFLSLFMFAFVGWNLLRGRPGNNASLLIYSNNQSYFQNFEDSIWDLYISITTANFPDVMMPAYDVNGAYSIFFISFMLINLYIFINIILATIYTNYKKHLKEEVRLSLELRRNKIKDAFDLIKFPLKNLPEMADFKTTEYIRNEYEYVVNFENFTKLMKNVKERINDKQMNILFDLLDIDGNRLLAFKEFVFLPDLLNIRLTELKDRQVIFEQLIPDIYNSKPSKILKKLVRHKIFQMFFDILILINMIFVFLQFSEDIEWFFLVAYLIEIFLKIYECGLVKFVNDYWNVFDSLIVFSGIIAGLVDEITGASESKSGGAGIFEIVLILRSLRLIKFVASVHRFRTIITTIAIITPSLINYAMLLLTIFYIFSMVGMEIFGTTIRTQQFVDRDSYNCFNPRLKDTDFVRFKYCKNNFSSFPNSLVLLFELMVVNQWHVLSRGFEDAMGSKFTRLFFLAFHISCVIVSLNIFTAFVIEAFLLEYENSDELTLDSKLETRIKKLGLNFESEPHDESSKTSKSWDEVKKFFKSLRDIVNVDDEDESPTSSSVRRGTESEHKSSLATQGVRFHINSKEPKSVDVLLQRMFSNEFDITQDDLLISNNNN